MAQQNISDPMQRDAVRRMQEMHRTANRHNESPKEEKVTHHEPAEKPVTVGAPRKTDTPMPLELQDLLADKDRSLILIIILLLLGEHSDTSLVMALVYLIL